MEKRTKASVNSTGSVIIGVSDVIRWNDEMEVNGHTIKISKAVELGIEHKIPSAKLLKRDLKAKRDCLLPFR